MKTNSEIVNINGIPIYSKDDMVVKAANPLGQFEPETFQYWLDYLKPCEYAVDIGAYTGIYSIAAHNALCSVHSFEPNDLVYARLIDNIELNGCTDITVHDCALSDQDGIKYFKRKDMPLTSAGSISDTGYGVPCRVLDSYFGKVGKVCSIKIDVEGHEYRVLKGAAQTIQRNKPLVIAEFLNDAERASVTNLMVDYGYQMPFVTDERNLVFIP